MVVDLISMMREWWWIPADATPTDRSLPDFDWLPDLQVLVERDSNDGLAIVAKAGHNGENHNHNDVGQLIVARHGRQVLIDAGAAVYDKGTFGPNRFDRWYCGSHGHNVPCINGHRQQAGKEHGARDVMLLENEDWSAFEYGPGRLLSR